MKRTKYIYQKDLKKYSKFYIPISKILLPTIQSSMKILYSFEKSNNVFVVEKFKVKSFDNYDLKVLVYSPKNRILNDKCLYYIHGGGFVFNAAPHHFKLAKQMALKLNCKAVFINYRLAPKYKFPVAPKDCFEVYKWIIDNSFKLNIDPNKIIIAGDSAGGNLALSTTNLAYQNNTTLPKGQILLYPVTTYNMVTGSYIKYVDTPMCNSKDMSKYKQLYYPKIIEEFTDYLSILDRNIFKFYPNTYIEVAQYDCLYDDGVLLYNKLVSNNVNCELYEVKEAMHGYDISIGSKLIDELIERRIQFINKI